MNFELQPMHVVLCRAKTSVICSPHFPPLKSPYRTSLWTDDATAACETEVFSGCRLCFYTFQKRGRTVQRMREGNIGSQTVKATFNTSSDLLTAVKNNKMNAFILRSVDPGLTLAWADANFTSLISKRWVKWFLSDHFLLFSPACPARVAKLSWTVTAGENK